MLIQLQPNCRTFEVLICFESNTTHEFIFNYTAGTVTNIFHADTQWKYEYAKQQTQTNVQPFKLTCKVATE